jgi:microcystin-dependent protein
MNTADFTTSSNGFPLESDSTLQFMQETYQDACNALARMAGSGNVILYGLDVTGGVASDGWVLLNGELIYFQGGATQSTFIIQEDVSQKANQDGTLYDRYFVRKCVFGSGPVQYNFADLARIESLQSIKQRFAFVTDLEPVVILSGCEIQGAAGVVEIDPGFVSFNGVLKATPGYLGPYPVYLKDDATFTTVLPTSGTFVTFNADTSQRLQHVWWRFNTPLNSILMGKWLPDYFDNTGMALPNTPYKGFAICNGQNNTVDLRSRFPVAYDNRTSDPGGNIWDPSYNTVNATGGSKRHTLTIAELPSHNHTGNTPSGGGVDPGEYGLIRKTIAGDSRTTTSTDATGSGTEPDLLSTPIDVPYQGGGQSHENRPPYLVLLFIQRVV